MDSHATVELGGYRLAAHRPVQYSLAKSRRQFNPWVSMIHQHHAVQFYKDDASLIKTVTAFCSQGLRRRETVVVIATPGHQAELREALLSTDDLPVSMDRFLCVDAGDFLSHLTIHGWADEDLFREVVGNMLEPVATDEPIRVYGEMTALLWAGGNYGAAIRLEQLWNRIGAEVPVSLLCGYPIASFRGTDDLDVSLLCDLHSHTLCDEKLAA